MGWRRSVLRSLRVPDQRDLAENFVGSALLPKLLWAARPANFPDLLFDVVRDVVHFTGGEPALAMGSIFVFYFRQQYCRRLRRYSGRRRPRFDAVRLLVLGGRRTILSVLALPAPAG